MQQPYGERGAAMVEVMVAQQPSGEGVVRLGFWWRRRWCAGGLWGGSLKG